MANNVKVVEVQTSKAGKYDKISLKYEHLTGKFKGQEWTTSNLLVKLPEADRKLLTSLNPGDLTAIETAQDKNGYWHLSVVRPPLREGNGDDVSTASTDKMPENSSTQYNKKEYLPKDETGIKVGTARNQALAFLSATKGAKFNLDDVDTVAYEIVVRQSKQEENIRNNNNPYDANPATERQNTPTVEDNFSDWDNTRVEL